MTRMHLLLPLLLVAGSSGVAFGQVPPPPLPAHGPAPLLFVRFLGPDGMHVAVPERFGVRRDFPAPATIGFRPGYLYRVELARLPDGAALYPTLEVRGTLQLPPRHNAADFPAPVVLTEQDIRQAQAGSLVTKVIYLENPDRAVPVAATPDLPFVTEVPPGRDAGLEARRAGRPVLIVRLGGRQFSPAELAQGAIPGTVLLPGEKSLMPPACPPPLAWACLQLVDPVLGPKPLEEECLKDGGDIGLAAGLDAEGRLHGVDPSDTVAEYADSQGRRRVVPSNRVCLCVPRFGVMRQELPLNQYEGSAELNGMRVVQGKSQLDSRLPSKQARQYDQMLAMRGRVRPSGIQSKQWPDVLLYLEVLNAHHIDIGPMALLFTEQARTLTDVDRLKAVKQMELARDLTRVVIPGVVKAKEGTAVVGRVVGPGTLEGVTETRDLTMCCNEPPRLPDRPLVLCKWVSTQAAKQGDVVTFFLKYSNQGGQPITDVAVTDSLTGRLEYVPGTAKSDRNAVFTLQENEAGSVALRWEVSGRLLPGESGVVSFQVKVR